MKSICLQYAAAAQWLVTYSIDAPETDSPELYQYDELKLRTRSQTQKVTSENATVIESILYVQRIMFSLSMFPTLAAFDCVLNVTFDVPLSGSLNESFLPSFRV